MYYLHTFYLKYLLKMTDGIAIMYNLSDFYLPVYSYSSSCHVIAICALRNLSQQTGAAVHRTVKLDKVHNFKILQIRKTKRVLLLVRQ